MLLYGGLGGAAGLLMATPTGLYAAIREDGEPLSRYPFALLAKYFAAGIFGSALLGFALGAATGLILWPIVQLARGWMRIVEPFVSASDASRSNHPPD
jgi:hypothetical protein